MRVAMIQLGCPKNWVDGENMMGRLLEEGHEAASDLEADAVIINTCGFIDSAKEESINTILQVAELKKSGRIKKLIVAGCLVQRFRDDLRKTIPEIDGFVPLSSAPDIVRLLSNPKLDERIVPELPLLEWDSPRVLSTPGHLAYVKIADGCNNRCAFCSIPGFRGKLRSRAAPDIVREVNVLTEGGVREIILVAQDTTAYGMDIGQRNGLTELLEALEHETDAEWIRLLYAYPNRINDGLLKTMASCRRVVPYIDIPLQHASTSILKAMKRGGSGESFLRLIKRLRSGVPGISIRSTFIVGFPGEGRKEFSELMDFVRAAKIDNLGVFPYSREEGTPAYRLGDPVKRATKENRVRKLMEFQAGISLEKNRNLIGKRVRVLVDGVSEESEHLLQGRTAGQAPDIDGCVLINDGFAKPGTFADVIISEAGSYDLVGGIVD